MRRVKNQLPEKKKLNNSGSAMILYHFTIHKGQPVVLVSMQNQGNPENMYYMYPTNNKDIQEAFANIVNDK